MGSFDVLLDDERTQLEAFLERVAAARGMAVAGERPPELPERG